MAKTRSQPLLGTFVEITLDAEAPDSLFDDAFHEMRALEKVFNFHDPESELSRRNRGEAPEVSASMGELLRVCDDLHAATHGLFDPRANGPLNLNGVAKGFIVDKICELLRARGAASALVNAGGDLRREGEGESEIHVRDRERPGKLRSLGKLRSGAVATSAGYYVESDSPYFDPRDGKRIERIPSVTVVAPYCVHADALTKLVMLAGAKHPALARFGAVAYVQS